MQVCPTLSFVTLEGQEGSSIEGLFSLTLSTSIILGIKSLEYMKNWHMQEGEKASRTRGCVACDLGDRAAQPQRGWHSKEGSWSL